MLKIGRINNGGCSPVISNRGLQSKVIGSLIFLFRSSHGSEDALPLIHKGALGEANEEIGPIYMSSGGFRGVSQPYGSSYRLSRVAHLARSNESEPACEAGKQE